MREIEIYSYMKYLHEFEFSYNQGLNNLHKHVYFKHLS